MSAQILNDKRPEIVLIGIGNRIFRFMGQINFNKIVFLNIIDEVVLIVKTCVHSYQFLTTVYGFDQNQFYYCTVASNFLKYTWAYGIWEA